MDLGQIQRINLWDECKGWITGIDYRNVWRLIQELDLKVQI